MQVRFFTTSDTGHFIDLMLLVKLISSHPLSSDLSRAISGATKSFHPSIPSLIVEKVGFSQRPLSPDFLSHPMPPWTWPSCLISPHPNNSSAHANHRIIDITSHTYHFKLFLNAHGLSFIIVLSFLPVTAHLSPHALSSIISKADKNR